MRTNIWSEEDLQLLEGQEKLSYLVDLARRSTTLPQELRTDDRLVPGCLSKIWVEVGLKEDGINIYYDSDALIPKGITTIVCDIFTGSTKEEAMKFISDTYSGVDIKDYNVAVNFAVTGDNGDEWVLLWDNGKTVTPDGKETSLNWMESFRFEGDKIAFINQFSKSRD